MFVLTCPPRSPGRAPRSGYRRCPRGGARRERPLPPRCLSAATAHRGSPGRIAQRALLPAARAHSGCELPIAPASSAPRAFWYPARPGARPVPPAAPRGTAEEEAGRMRGGAVLGGAVPALPGAAPRRLCRRLRVGGGRAKRCLRARRAAAPGRGAVRCGAARSGAEHVGAAEEAGR